MVDRNYRPWLVEVNHSPSFSIDTPLDASIKTALIMNTLKMVRSANHLFLSNPCYRSKMCSMGTKHYDCVS